MANDVLFDRWIRGVYRYQGYHTLFSLTMLIINTGLFSMVITLVDSSGMGMDSGSRIHAYGSIILGLSILLIGCFTSILQGHLFSTNTIICIRKKIVCIQNKQLCGCVKQHNNNIRALLSLVIGIVCSATIAIFNGYSSSEHKFLLQAVLLFKFSSCVLLLFSILEWFLQLEHIVNLIKLQFNNTLIGSCQHQPLILESKSLYYTLPLCLHGFIGGLLIPGGIVDITYDGFDLLFYIVHNLCQSFGIATAIITTNKYRNGQLMTISQNKKYLKLFYSSTFAALVTLCITTSSIALIAIARNSIDPTKEWLYIYSVFSVLLGTSMGVIFYRNLHNNLFKYQNVLHISSMLVGLVTSQTNVFTIFFKK